MELCYKCKEHFELKDVVFIGYLTFCFKCLRKLYEKLNDKKCINANRKIGTCIERCIVERIKAGEDYRQVFDDYGIKIK